ncbi:MAG: hypothetical protein AAF383_06970 [Cyanobacteria bacterium P01_A01_bin.83]
MKNSHIAKFLQIKLEEIESFLNKAPTRFPKDSGAEICKDVLQEFHNILQPASPVKTTNKSQNKVITSKNSNSEDMQQLTSAPSTSSNLTPADESKLDKFKQTFKSDEELQKYLGEIELKSQTYADLWNEIQRKLLRLPKKRADFWQEKIKQVFQDVGVEIDTSNMKPLPYEDDQIIFPGLKGTIQAEGLCLSNKAPLDSLVLQTIKSENLSKDLSGDLYLLASLVSICITFTELEPDLHHALETVHKFGVVHLYTKFQQRQKYINVLIQRFGRVLRAQKNADKDPVSLLNSWIAVDEAIHSLIFIPPADYDSWWGNLKKQTRRILRKVAQEAKEKDHDVRIKELSGLYADIRKFSSKDYDLQLEVGGIPGEVQICLRVYASIDNNKSPGRVIFRLL